ncbi:MAG: hypothetical protein RLZZ455_301 [Candidatus Parcubacteria bacterium]|jgi:hypothetical protein
MKRKNKTIQLKHKREIKVIDNFEHIGMDNFVRLALSALEVSKTNTYRKEVNTFEARYEKR